MMRLRNTRVKWNCDACKKSGNVDIREGVGLSWAEVTEHIAKSHAEVSQDCKFEVSRMSLDFERYGDEEKKEG
jgi:hypothetical protein